MPSTRLRRLSTFSYLGPYRYSLTFCTFDRQPFFEEVVLVDLVRAQVLRAGEVCGFDVLAYCFMPDHLHLLAGGAMGPAHLPTFAKRAKQLSGFYGRKLAKGPLWQAGYFEHVLRADEDTRCVAAYILGNPVRAGLVLKPEDYAFSGSGVWSLAELLNYANGRDPRSA